MIDQAKPTQRKKPTNADWFEEDYCYNYMSALAKRLNCDVRVVASRLMWFAFNSRFSKDGVCWTADTLLDYEKIKFALAVGGEDD